MILHMYKPTATLAIRASVDALCRDGAGQISRERVQRGRLIPREQEVEP